MLNLIYNIAVTVFPCVGLNAGAFLPKLFRQNLIRLFLMQIGKYLNKSSACMIFTILCSRLISLS